MKIEVGNYINKGLLEVIMKIEVGNYINKGLFQFGFGILFIKTEVTIKIVIDFLCFYFEIIFE